MTFRTPRAVVGLTVGVFLFLHLPILVLVAFSFNDSKFSVEWQGFTLDWYQRLLERPDIPRDAFVEELVPDIDEDARRVVVDPPPGLLELGD